MNGDGKMDRAEKLTIEIPVYNRSKENSLRDCEYCGRKYDTCCICDAAEKRWNETMRATVKDPYPGKGMNSYRVYADGNVVFQDDYDEEDMYVDYTGHEREFDEYVIPDELVDHIADSVYPAGFSFNPERKK